MGSPGNKWKVPDGFNRGQHGFMVQLEAQGGHCAICGVQQGMELIPDHDHLSGRARGLLCVQCNTGIGMLGDDLERMRAAIVYVSTWRLAHAEQAERDKAERKARHVGVKRSSLYGPDGQKTRSV